VAKGGLPASNDWARATLISGNHRDSENAVRDAIARGKMRPVLDAVNYLASTGFIINKPVLAFMLRREEPRIQKLAADVAELERERELRKLNWHQRQKLANLRAELSIWSLDTAVANAMGRFQVPLQIDFRGRINPMPFFNFTREDHIRALFLFADGEPIGEEGLLYLKSHVAGCADGNKWSTIERPGNLDLDGRVGWTDDNLELLRKFGNAVLGGDDPAQWDWLLRPDMADTLVTFAKPGGDIVEVSNGDPKREGISDPYQFIAACVELARALDKGPSFETRLPLVFDATCSGLQHICAMTRAEEGRYVNLVPSDELSDFYSLLGTRVYRELFHIAEVDDEDFVVFRENPETLDLRHLFKDDNPFDRKIVKRPGMTYGYGSRAGGWAKKSKHAKRLHPKGMTEQIVEVLKERGMSAKGAHKLAKVIYNAIEELMPAAKVVRDFLEGVAKVCAKYDKPLRWTMPLGLPILNAYYDPIKERYSVKINGRRRRTDVTIGDTDDIDPTGSRNSVTANFVHAADACHLQMVALAADKENIPLATIHDCFGTLAPRAKRLNEILREQFVRLHRHNLLNELREAAKRDLPKRTHAKLPELPKIGNLEIEGVLKSFFAFK
jgi:DNA-directed RNA polymerase